MTSRLENLPHTTSTTIMKQSTIALGILAGIGFTSMVPAAALTGGVVNRARKPRARGGPMWSGRTTELELRPEDYAEVRKTFRTKLVRRGPSPQPVTEEIRIPAGVRKVE